MISSQVRNCSMSAWQFCLLGECIVAPLAPAVSKHQDLLCSDDKLMRQLDASLIHVYLEMRCTKAFSTIKFLTISLLDCPHFLTGSGAVSEVSFTSFCFGVTFALSLFPFVLQQCSGTSVFAFSFQRNLFTRTPSMTASLLQTLFLAINYVISAGLLSHLQLPWMRIQRWCLFTSKRLHPISSKMVFP